jgi:hypothetical protein
MKNLESLADKVMPLHPWPRLPLSHGFKKRRSTTGNAESLGMKQAGENPVRYTVRVAA